MARIIVPPAAPLSRFVRHFLVETDLAGMSLLPAISFPTIVLMVSGASRPQGLDTVPPAFVSGAQPLPLWLELQPGTSFISAMLKPGCLEVFFDLPVERLTGTNIPLDELIGPANQSTLLAQTLAARDAPQIKKASNIGISNLAGASRQPAMNDKPAVSAACPRRRRSVLNSSKVMARSPSLRLIRCAQ